MTSGRDDALWSPDPDPETGLRIRFGENVSLLRAHAHISQEEIAVHLPGVGADGAQARDALKLAAALEVELSTLLDGIYRPRFFSAARGEFEISSTGLFDRTAAPTAGSAEERDR